MEHVAFLNEQLAAYKAAQDPSDKSYILAYDNGLCIAFAPDGKSALGRAYACDILMAEVVGVEGMPEEAWAFMPNVFNGHNEPAKVAKRQAALVKQIAAVEGLLARFGEGC